MKYISLCSGIEAATVAWHPLGWEPLWFSEVEPFCCTLLNHYYPDTPNLGDMTAITEGDLERFPKADVLVGGTPCQSFSVAGLRKGMADPRGNLALRFFQLAGILRPRWLLWENVPGVLSSDEGRDFGSILGAMAELGYGFAYRILDAQYFGVPQRRRRVFVVGYLGDWRRAAAVLLERESLCGHPPPSREAGAGVAGSVTQRIDRGGVNSEGHDEHLVAHPLTQRYDSSEDGCGRGTPLVPVAFDCKQSGEGGEVSPPLRALNHDKSHANAGGQAAVAYQCHGSNVGEMGHLRAGNGNETGGVPFVVAQNGSDIQVGDTPGAVTAGQAKQTSGDLVAIQDTRGLDKQQNGKGWSDEDVGYTVDAAATQGVAQPPMAVRRLTPRECERLQGFPDDYTRIPYRNKPAEQCPDGPRYRALGNSMAVPVMRWLGKRIIGVDTE